MADNTQKLVERFYYELWNKADEAVAYEILSPDFIFRGSLGDECKGIDGFLNYMRMIHAALADYECIIDDILTTTDRAAAKLRFRGVHQGTFFQVEPTGRTLEWQGAAFFDMTEQQIKALWVLGDVDNLKLQLQKNS